MGAEFTCFTRTKVQILTPVLAARTCAPRPRSQRDAARLFAADMGEKEKFLRQNTSAKVSAWSRDSVRRQDSARVLGGGTFVLVKHVK